MKNVKKVKWFAMMISLILIFTFSVQSTFGYIVTSTPSIVNTFKPFKNIVNNLKVNKIIEHPFGNLYEIPDNISFEFDIDFGADYKNYTFETSQGDKTADQNGRISVAVKPNAAFTVENVDVGTKVKVTEKQNKNGFTVKDSAERELTVSENGELSFDFVNVYSPKAIKTDITVMGTKVLEGRDWLDGDSFKFLLEYDGGNGNWKEIDSKTVNYDKNKTEFNKFDFTDAVQKLEFSNIGTYSFRLTEVMGELEGIVYDETIKYFQIYVTDVDMDGSLEVEKVTGSENVTIENGKVSVIFNNMFKTPAPVKPDDITVNVTVSKKISSTGKETISPENFKFLLTDNNTGKKMNLTSNADGIALHSLKFTADDIGKTYTYTLNEVNDGRENITYSAEVYKIAVTVAYDEINNKLIAKLMLNEKDVNSLTVIFTNIYNYVAESPSAPPTEDSSKIAFWFAIMLLSGSAIIILAVRRKRWDI